MLWMVFLLYGSPGRPLLTLYSICKLILTSGLLHQNPIYPNKIQFILTKSIIIQCKLIWTYSTFIAFYRLLTLYSNCKLILTSSPLHQNPIYPNKIYYNLTANWFGHKVFCIKIQYIPTKYIIFQLQIYFDI